MPDLIETIMTELKQRRDWNNPEEVEIWFEEKLREVEAKAKAEERERVVGEIDDAQYNSRAEGCGLEDLGITNRYEAMEYGWQQCKEGVLELASLDKPLNKKD